MDIGYVGKSNKQLIKTGQDVDDAYTSRFDHKYEELVIYIEEKKGKRQGQNRLIGMVDGLFSFTSIVILFLLLFMLISFSN